MVVSALVLNFIPDKEKALAEMGRVARSGATVRFYVWDYPGGGAEFMRAFWTAATALDPGAVDLTEDRRFPFCTPDGLTNFAKKAGLVPSTAQKSKCRLCSGTLKTTGTPSPWAQGPRPATA